ncbi:hypothetical protein M0657_008428 [Pyricularia oryzae]|nr:hypothetical protein M9X92_010374 [Pyricularia oryzae]KAI7916765.1 hypothetical protein M0657_008428 [Pyricularia oryzae]
MTLTRNISCVYRIRNFSRLSKSVEVLLSVANVLAYPAPEFALKTAPTPTGDKIILPSSALQQLLDANAAAASASAASAYSYSTPVVTRYTSPYNSFGSAPQPEQQKLPYPLMFRLVNERNGKFVHAGVREFSAEEGQVTLSPFLLRSLGLAEQENTSTVDDGEAESGSKRVDNVRISAHQLPKGVYVGLAPVHDYASYDPAILEPLLERELRQGYTTLSTGTILQVKRGPTEDYEFTVESVKPEGDGICVIDTDLELDLLRIPTATAQEAGNGMNGSRETESTEKSPPGGDITIWKSVEGQVRHGDYVDYDLSSWDKSRGLVIEAVPQSDEAGIFLDIFVSPKTPHLRQRPRELQHWTARMGPYTNREPVRLEIPAGSFGNDEVDEVEGLMISIYGFRNEAAPAAGPQKFSLRVDTWDATDTNRAPTSAADVVPEDVADLQKCKDCGQWIPKQSFTMHTLRCARNPKCAQCGFVASRDELGEHWHCDHCSSYGDRLFAQQKHNGRMHPSNTLRCSCSATLEFDSVPALSRHRVTDCPDKVILCRFCHLEVPQEGDPTDPSDVAQAAYTGLTAHERADGARTADCDLCGAIVRLRDMSSHLRHHEMDKKGRAAPSGCRNSMCGRTLHGVGPRGTVGPPAGNPNNDMGFCKSCYGPLYVSMHDPEGKALRRRVERRYLTQLMTGCGRSWCSNEWCRTGRANTGKEALGTSASAALPLVKPLVTPEVIADKNAAMHFCVDEATQRNVVVAEMLAAEGVWGPEWCVAAVEAEKGDRDRAREWLQNWAPNKYE